MKKPIEQPAYPPLPSAANAELQTLANQRNRVAVWPDWFVGQKDLWTYPVSLRWLALDQNGFPASLITPRHVLQCQHVVNVETIHFWADDYHATVFDWAWIGGDLKIGTLAEPVPNIQPVRILPQNYNTPPACFQAVFARRNKHRLNTVRIKPSDDYNGMPAVRVSPMVPHNYDRYASVGDSGSPVFTILEGRALLLAVISTSYLAGPWLSSYPELYKVPGIDIVDCSRFAKPEVD